MDLVKKVLILSFDPQRGWSIEGSGTLGQFKDVYDRGGKGEVYEADGTDTLLINIDAIQENAKISGDTPEPETFDPDAPIQVASQMDWDQPTP